MTQIPHTDYAARADAYAESIVTGERPACRLTRLAAQRHLNDRAREAAGDFDWVFDAEAVAHICGFIESLPHIEGALASDGALLVLDDWQVFVCASINGWRDPLTGLRRFRTAYIEVPRKNGKSTLLSAIGLYFLTVDGEAGAKVYSAAASTHQARIVFDIANAMARTAEITINGQRRPMTAALGLKVEEHKIRLTHDHAGVFQPIASQTKSKDGKNPHLGIVDELHEHEKPDVWNSMASALGARAHPLLIAITTSGWNVAGICYEQHRYLVSLLDGTRTNEAYFGIIYAADEGDDPADPAVWAKANPGLGTAKSLRYMQDQWNMATASAYAMGEFLRKHLDRWTSVGASAFDLDGWTGGQRPGITIEHYAGREAYIGVDLGLKDDLTTVAVTIPDDEYTIVFATHFATQAQIDTPENDHLAGFAREGRLTICPGSRIDDEMVEAEILRLAAIVTALETVFDPWRAASLMARVASQGLDVTEFRQSPMNMSVPVETLQGLVEERRLITDGDPVLHWMAANAVVRKNGDFLRLEKLDRTAKIDGIAAIATALGRVLAVEEATPTSPWDDPEYTMAAE